MICTKRKWKGTRALNRYGRELVIFTSSFFSESGQLNKKYYFTFRTINAILKNVTYFLYVALFFLLFDYEEKG